MKIHEYQGKELFRKYGVATPRGTPCFSVDEALAAARALGGKVWVVKAQIHAGGAGKGGGVEVGEALGGGKEVFCRMFGQMLKKQQNVHRRAKMGRALL